jgi:NAD(P)-dependent dehydrogenase (short-subunit alcohol dehydrogenase family)
MDLNGRSALVTGGAGGLGAATVRRLVGLGVGVAIFDRDATLPLARDLGVLGIRVCAVAPGTMGTPIMLSVPEETQAHLVQSIVFPKRMGRPEEFALLVESIARNPYLNGENIRLDGALRFPPR